MQQLRTILHRHWAAGSVLAAGCAVAAWWWIYPPGMAATLINTIWCCTTTLLVIGAIWIRRPARRWPWYALALAMGVYTVADLMWNLLEWKGGSGYSSMLAAVLYLIGYAAYIAAGVGWLNPKSRKRDLPVLFEAIAYALAAWLVVWVVWVAPHVIDTHGQLWDWLASVAYPPLDIIFLVILWRVGRGRLRRNVCWALMFASFIPMLGADTLGAIWQMPAAGFLPHFLDLLWLMPYTLAGAAAVDKSMRHLEAEPEPRWVVGYNPGRLATLSLAVVTPALLLWWWPRETTTNSTVVAILAVCIGLAVMLRLAVALGRRRDAYKIVSWQGTHDELTGLLNRGAFIEAVEVMQREAAAHDQSCCVLLIGLDDFKKVNASHSYARGDLILGEVANRLTNCAPTAAIARVGGDEFAICHVGNEEIGAQVSATILAALHVPCVFDGEQARVGTSIGVADWSESSVSALTLLRNAGMALHLAKGQGRSQIALFNEELHRQAQERHLLEEALAHALEAEEFQVAYQPIVHLASGNVYAYEALLRWTRPGRGPVSPAAFIPVAEASGLSIPLGDYVFAAATQQLAGWRARQQVADSARMSINVSAYQLVDPGLASRFCAAVAAVGLEPANVILEITESAFVEQAGVTNDNLNALRDAGFVFAMDDFGTGYSNLAQLALFTSGTLKIDKSFVDGLGQDTHSEVMVRTIVAMARGLGLKTTAEGIETPEQLEILHHLECDHIQGYLYGKPTIPADAESPPVTLNDLTTLPS